MNRMFRGEAPVSACSFPENSAVTAHILKKVISKIRFITTSQKPHDQSLHSGLSLLTHQAKNSEISPQNSPLQSDSCYSLRKTGDFSWECLLGEEEGIKHDEQISIDAIVLDHVVIDGILTS